MWFTAREQYTYVFFITPPSNGTLLLPCYKPSTLLASPLAVTRLISTGPPLIVPWTLTSSGLSVLVGDLIPLTIPLTTYFRSYNSNFVDNAPCGSRDCSIYTSDSYVKKSIEGSCLTSAGVTAATSASDPTVPLYLFYNNNMDNVAGPVPPADGQNWQNIDLECAAYTSDGPNRIPLELWHSALLNDWWTLSSDVSRSAAIQSGYVKNATIGYLLATTATPTAAEAYAYVVRIEWAT